MPDPIVPAHTSIPENDNRITIPKHLSERIEWDGTDIQIWLLLLAPGRYRILLDEQVQNDPKLEPIRLLILEGKPALNVAPSFAVDFSAEAIVAKLVPTRMEHPPKKTWRIVFPSELNVFAPPDCDPNAFSILFSLEGYWEIWYTNVLRTAVLSSPGRR
jgi:hypothetical protein